jgi:glycosyltransferase involved in cell wall biosynthesis
VTTRVAGIPSLVSHGVNGLLVEPPPTAATVAGQMSRIIGDAALRRALIRGGYATAATFTLEAQAARMMDVVSSSLHVELRRPAVVPAV